MRGIPAVNKFLEHPTIAPYEYLVGRESLRCAINEVVERVRAAGDVPPFERLVADVIERVEADAAMQLLPVINATGVLLHTNLGRAPLPEHAFSVSHQMGAGYCNLEYDVIEGTRGSRYARVSALLRELTGAQDALVVNNCAAAMLLILDTFARGNEVICARNQLIEVGGGFRIPDVLSRSGADLVEVGATNKVYLRDFERALSPRTALLLRTHPSNYRIEGFVHDASTAQVCELGKRAGVPVVEDLGSGALVDLAEYGLPHERTVQEAVADGVDLIAFSGDKLLGGPQAGIIVGSSAAIARLRANPLLRALRTDKITLAMLAGTLRLYRTRESREHIPFYRMLATTLDELRDRGRRYAGAIAGSHVVDSIGYVGGGSMPQSVIPSVAVTFTTPHADVLAERLRRSRTPIVARVDDGCVLIDLRTIAPVQDEAVINTLLSIAG